MSRSAQGAFLCPILLAVMAVPLTAQYAAHVTVTGGTHAGTYELRRPTCTMDGRSEIRMVDTSAASHTDRVVSVLLASPTFVVEFGHSSPSGVTPAGFAGPDASKLKGVGLLNLTWVYGNETFRGEVAGVALDGQDSVKVAVKIGCKGVKRIP